MKQVAKFVGLFIVCGLCVISCSQKQESKSTKTIGVSLLTRAHVFYKDLEEGLKAEAAKNGYELIVTAGEFDLGKQSSQIEDFITRKVDAIAVAVENRAPGGLVHLDQTGRFVHHR